MHVSRSFIILGAVSAISALAFVAPVRAQDGGQPAPTLAPPTPGKPDNPPVVMNYLTMLLIIASVVGANLIPSKRGHQD